MRATRGVMTGRLTTVAAALTGTRRSVAACTGMIAAIALLTAASSAGAATTRVVAPGSARMTDPCTAAKPCEYYWAITNSASGDAVAFESGEYDYDGSVHTSTLAVPQGITLEQAPGDATRPLIKQTVEFNPGNEALMSLQEGDVVEDLDIDQASGTAAHDAGAVEMGSDATILRSTLEGKFNGMYAAVSGTPGLRDTLVVAHAGVAVQNVGAGTLNLDNVTAIAHYTGGLAGTAIYANNSGGAGAPAIIATNTIARGDTADVEADTPSSAAATVTLHYSDARSAMEVASGTGATITDTDHPTHTEPVFVSGGFAEGPGSPTIDAGTPDSASEPLDLAGLPRDVGPAPDIGAYEFQAAAPIVTTGAASALGSTTATLAGTIDAQDSLSTWQFRYGPTTAYGAETTAQSLPAVLGTQSLSATLSGLAPATTYHYQLVDSSPFGSLGGTDGTFTTAAAPLLLPASLAPVDSALVLSATRFRAASSGATISKSRVAVGTAVSYSDSQAATSTLVVQQRRAGVRRGKSCIAPPRHRKRNHHYSRCIRYTTLGSTTHRDSAGANYMHFSGRLRGHKLLPGGYRLTLTPRNAAGKTGATLTKSFTIIR